MNGNEDFDQAGQNPGQIFGGADLSQSYEIGERGDLPYSAAVDYGWGGDAEGLGDVVPQGAALAVEGAKPFDTSSSDELRSETERSSSGVQWAPGTIADVFQSAGKIFQTGVDLANIVVRGVRDVGTASKPTPVRQIPTPQAAVLSNLPMLALAGLGGYLLYRWIK